MYKYYFKNAQNITEKSRKQLQKAVNINRIRNIVHYRKFIKEIKGVLPKRKR